MIHTEKKLKNVANNLHNWFLKLCRSVSTVFATSFFILDYRNHQEDKMSVIFRVKFNSIIL